MVEAAEQGLDERAVADVYLQQLITDRVSQFGHAAPWLELHLLEEDFSRPRGAVCVEPAGGQTAPRIAGSDHLSVQDFGLFHHADDRSAHVVFARLMKARHLGGFDESGTI